MTPSKGMPKRKWNEVSNVAILKELIAAGAHILSWNEATQRFAEALKRELKCCYAGSNRPEAL